MPSYILPQVLVFQEFERSPVAVAQPLRACIVGEQFGLHRYSDADEKLLIDVGAYDPDTETCYPWPSKDAGSTVDQTYTKVFIDDALLNYYSDAIGSGGTIKAVPTLVSGVAAAKNRVRASALVWKTANGVDRSGALLRDVKVGDVVKLSGDDCTSNPITFETTVIGFVPDKVAAVTGTAAADTGNKGATNVSSKSTPPLAPVSGALNQLEIDVVTSSAYNGLPDGDLTEVYTIEVVNGGVVGSAGVSFRVTSQSGRDDVGLTDGPASLSSTYAVGTRGLTIEFDDTASGIATPATEFITGQIWHVTAAMTFVVPTKTSGGTYTGTTDTTYVVEVTKGGLFAGVDPEITVTTTTGIDGSGPTTVTATGVAVAIGTKGVTLTFSGGGVVGLCLGDKYTIAATAEADGAVRTLALANNITDDLRGYCSGSQGAAPDLNIDLYIKKNIEVPENASSVTTNWTQSTSQLCLAADINGYDSEWVSGGTLEAIPVKGGTVYVEHRDRLSDNCDVVGTISDVSLVASTLGTVHPDNPLAFGVFKALENANGEEVKYLGVCGDAELADWLESLDQLVGRDDVYSLVPLSQNKDVLDAFEAHCLAESTPESGRWRIAWLNQAAEEVIDVYTVSALDADQPILATIKDDPATAGTQYTLVEAPGETFIDKGVRARDTLRALYTVDVFGNTVYSEFVVDSVVNQEALLLVSGPDAIVNPAAKIEIRRTLTKTELATNLATKPGLFSNRRAFLVWPDLVGNAGLTFAGYFLCAGLAGLRSGVLPHQGLTNVELLGFDDVTRSVNFFSAAQLNVMAASGYWIVTQDPNDGTIFSRHQLSTGDQTDVNMREQNITTNLDHISVTFLTRLKSYIGKGNVTPTMINILRGEIVSVIEEFKNNISVDRLGPQIIDANVIELRQHPTFKDRVICRIVLTLPAPLNNVELHLIA